MSGVSFQEFFLLIVIGLVILGPKRLPQVANQIGSWLGQARRMTRMMKRQLEDEINLDLNSINVKQQLGLDENPDGSSTTAKADVSRPSYVYDRKPGAAKEADKVDDAGETEDTEEEAEELPDDYSPAHGADDIGTGVGDDDDVDDEDVIEPTDELRQLADAESPPDEKKEKTA